MLMEEPDPRQRDAVLAILAGQALRMAWFGLIWSAVLSALVIYLLVR